jgi:hypothetical protein
MSFSCLAAEGVDSLLTGGVSSSRMSASHSIQAAADEANILSVNGRNTSSAKSHLSPSLTEQNHTLFAIPHPKTSFLTSPGITSASGSASHQSLSSFLFGGSDSKSNSVAMSSASSSSIDGGALRTHKGHHGKRVNTAFDAAGYARELLQALTR